MATIEAVTPTLQSATVTVQQPPVSDAVSSGQGVGQGTGEDTDSQMNSQERKKRERDVVTLRLVSGRRRNKKSKVVHWAAGVVDNEFLGKKSSKKCCIFHKKREFGDWSDSDTDRESDKCTCQR